MDWRERKAQVAQFRPPDGARFCIATDAAGEGIDLPRLGGAALNAEKQHQPYAV